MLGYISKVILGKMYTIFQKMLLFLFTLKKTIINLKKGIF